MGPFLVAAAPSNKDTCLGDGHYWVIDTVGVELGQTGEDGQAGHQGREQERDDGSCWSIRAGRTVVDWDGRRGRACDTGRKKYQQTIYVIWLCVREWVFLLGGSQGEIQGVVRPTRLIRFGGYNIRNGWNGGLESALRGMSQFNMDLGVFQETKLTKYIYMRESSGYRVVVIEAPSAHSGSVIVFYRAAENFSVEAIQTYGANVVSFQLASGDMQWFIVG